MTFSTPPKIIQKILKPPPVFSPEKHKTLKNLKKSIIANLQAVFPATHASLDHQAVVSDLHPITTVHSCIENLIMIEKLNKMDLEYKSTYADLFPVDIPHVSELPQDVLMTIKLCNTQKPMVTHANSCPQKYCESWGTLVQHHFAVS